MPAHCQWKSQQERDMENHHDLYPAQPRRKEGLDGHPMAGRMDSATQNTATAQANSGATARVILDTTNDPNAAESSPKHLPMAKDVNNLLQKHRASVVKGRTPIQALYDILCNNENWTFEVQFDSHCHVTPLFFASSFWPCIQKYCFWLVLTEPIASISRY